MSRPSREPNHPGVDRGVDEGATRTAQHADAWSTLARWSPPDPGQRALGEDYRAYLHSHVDATSRACIPSHLTASALVCDPAGRHVLLVRHRRLGRWLQTGGHVEPDDPSLAAAALREAREESGIRDLALVGPDPVRLDRHEVRCSNPGATEHLDVQYVVVTRGTGGTGGLVDDLVAPVCSAESTAVAWWPADALPDDVDASVRALVEAARTRLGTTGSQRR